MSNCPFCGVVTETPHKTQEACIAALNAEIARTRELIETVRESEVLPPPQIGEALPKNRV